ncbi:MAG: NIL domain-containing protein [Dehalococcoidia bacterium]
MTALRRVKFTFPPGLITRPVIYELGQRFQIVTNIRRAEVGPDVGWVVLELDGPEDQIDSGLAWVEKQGVQVSPVTGDIIEG